MAPHFSCNISYARATNTVYIQHRPPTGIDSQRAQGFQMMALSKRLVLALLLCGLFAGCQHTLTRGKQRSSSRATASNKSRAMKKKAARTTPEPPARRSRYGGQGACGGQAAGFRSQRLFLAASPSSSPA